MNFFEFTQQLGANPTSQEPEFLRARNSSPEFIQAASESDRFERNLRAALVIAAPQDLLANIKEISASAPAGRASWRHYALAASLLLAVAVTGITWRMNTMSFDSVEQYLAYHYNHDGQTLVLRGAGQEADNVNEILARFQVKMTPDISRMVGFIKFCPTPDGKGAHIVLNTDSGPITVIFMPDTAVTDGEMLAFDGLQAQLVTLEHGSAAIIGTDSQGITRFHQLVQNSILPIEA